MTIQDWLFESIKLYNSNKSYEKYEDANWIMVQMFAQIIYWDNNELQDKLLNNEKRGVK
jgi:hypothetical protein